MPELNCKCLLQNNRGSLMPSWTTILWMLSLSLRGVVKSHRAQWCLKIPESSRIPGDKDELNLFLKVIQQYYTLFQYYCRIVKVR